MRHVDYFKAKFKDFFIYILLGLSIFIVFVSTAAYVITKDSNFIIAGLSAILIIVTSWYASNADRQFRVMENSRKGRYIAEISRSIISPMQKSLFGARRDLVRGQYLEREPGKERPIKIYLSARSPKSYLTKLVEIIPDRRSRSDIGNIWRPASFLLKIKENDDILRRELEKLDSLSNDYDKLVESLENVHLDIDDQISSVLPAFKKYISEIDPVGFEHLLNTSKKEINFEENVLIAIIMGVLIHQKTITFLNSWGEIISIDYEEVSKPRKDDPHNGVFTRNLPGEGEYERSILKFMDENREKILEWLDGTALAHNIERLTKVQKGLLSTIDQLLGTIDSILINWKLHYFLVEDEMHGS